MSTEIPHPMVYCDNLGGPFAELRCEGNALEVSYCCSTVEENWCTLQLMVHCDELSEVSERYVVMCIAQVTPLTMLPSLSESLILTNTFIYAEY